VVKSTLEDKAIVPDELIFLNTLTVLLLSFTAIKSELPSPSMSPDTTHTGAFPAVYSIFDAKEFVVNPLPPPMNVTIKGWAENAVSPFTATVIGWKVAPAGTVTVSEDETAVVTTAFTAPKKTILSVAVVLKLLPEIVTAVPTGPETGENELIVGTWARIS
jgi:hypothetical protein